MKKLIDVMKILRGPNGCPWDQKQDFESLMPCLIEEAYEVVDAVLLDDQEKVVEELGDALCIISMLIAIGETESRFTKKQVVNGAVKKMKHRHPHVFGKAKAKTAEEAYAIWQKQKKREKTIQSRMSILDDISPAFSSLIRAEKIQRRVSRVKFDWPTVAGVFDKVEEELAEIKQELRKKKKSQKHIKEEVGDLLFAVVNLSRKLGVNAEVALAKTNHKFIQRFQAVEEDMKRSKKKLGETPLKDLEKLWQQAKKKERSSFRNKRGRNK